jgi:hypothetical protein
MVLEPSARSQREAKLQRNPPRRQRSRFRSLCIFWPMIMPYNVDDRHVTAIYCRRRKFKQGLSKESYTYHDLDILPARDAGIEFESMNTDHIFTRAL